MTKVWIIIGLIAATAAGMGVMALIGGIDPLHSKRMGPGWECDVGKGSVCVKDGKLPK